MKYKRISYINYHFQYIKYGTRFPQRDSHSNPYSPRTLFSTIFYSFIYLQDYRYTPAHITRNVLNLLHSPCV